MIKKIRSIPFQGQTYELFEIKNKKGSVLEIFTYGARITRLCVPDKNGNFADVILGLATPEDYLGKIAYYGATIGRFANRIEKGKFTLGGKEYALEINDKSNHLHGGVTANFDAQNFSAEILGDELVLSHLSKDGAGGYPGNLSVKVTFSLNDADELAIDYFATTDKDTLCNLTNHAYFNLGDDDTILDHELMIKARKMTAVDDELIPHGAFLDIDNTPYSFYEPKTIGQDTFSSAELIKKCNGYDFNYCIEREKAGLAHCAYVYDKKSGRRMDCYTTLPGVQLYTCCHMALDGKKRYGDHAALCLETQGYPNSPNCPQYPSTVLKAGDVYSTKTVYKFSVWKEKC